MAVVLGWRRGRGRRYFMDENMLIMDRNVDVLARMTSRLACRERKTDESAIGRDKLSVFGKGWFTASEQDAWHITVYFTEICRETRILSSLRQFLREVGLTGKIELCDIYILVGMGVVILLIVGKGRRRVPEQSPGAHLWWQVLRSVKCLNI